MEARHAELLEAVRAGDAERVRGLLEQVEELAGARDARGVSAVLIAAEAGHEELVRLLLDANPALDAHDAAAVGRTRALAELLDADAAVANRVGPTGDTPLQLAAAHGQKGAAELLLERGADPFATDAAGRTPAQRAAAAGHDDVAARLREAMQRG